MTPLRELADIIRSKNAGPFRITLDILFADRGMYQAVKKSGAITRQSVAMTYGIAEDRISSIFEVDMAQAFKITLFRPVAQGGQGEGDMYGCQHHVPLLSLPVVWTDGSGKPEPRPVHMGDVENFGPEGGPQEQLFRDGGA